MRIGVRIELVTKNKGIRSRLNKRACEKLEVHLRIPNDYSTHKRISQEYYRVAKGIVPNMGHSGQIVVCYVFRHAIIWL